MPSNSEGAWKGWMRDPRHAVRLALGVLLAANLAAAWFVFHPPGGSVESLEQEIASTRRQLAARQQAVARLKAQAEKALAAREEGERFLRQCFLPRQHAYSLLEIELANAARRSGVRQKERTVSFEPIEGSQTLGALVDQREFRRNLCRSDRAAVGDRPIEAAARFSSSCRPRRSRRAARWR